MSLAYCAFMERSSVIVADDELSERHSATLTLKRGAASWGVWSFDAHDAGAAISVGGSAGCDWQVAAPGAGPLQILFTGEQLYAKDDGMSDDAWLNGARLWRGWVPLEHGDCLEIGPCCMEVAIAAPPAPFARSHDADLPHTTRETESDSNTVSHERCVRRYSGTSQTWAYETQRELPVRSADATWDETDALPSILGDLPDAGGARLKRTLLFGTGVAIAYAGWVALLDYI